MVEAAFPYEDRDDYSDAERGRIGSLENAVVKNDDGEIVWDNDSYSFLAGERPESVHASLWRQSGLVARQGLFEVVEGIYQVRGLDLSNISFVEGDTGVIVIDPLISVETARAAYALYRQHRGDRPVTGVIYTHSHVDHFGGVKGVVSQEDADARKAPIIAPAGFLEHAITENMYAGTAMARRSGYMFGAALARGARGGVGAGLGQTASTGSVSLIPPTVDITHTGQELTVDGVGMLFQLTPNTEAPAEMHFLFPDHRALCMAENATHTLHNLLTLRGALVRDPHAWARYLTEAIEMFGDKADVVFASHHWPVWGADRVGTFLGLQRDLYAYLHDQTLRLLNKGYTGVEIAEMIELPPALRNVWHTHGYYGSVNHNVKAIYQRYMGWFDGHPSRLWQHPPQEAARRYVEFMGGADAVVDKARASADSGDLRWAAQVLDHVIFAEPEHTRGRALLADVFERLGFGCENGVWRNFYLSGATELRQGNFGTPTATSSPDMFTHLPPEMFFDSVAVQIDGPRAWTTDVAIRWEFPDHGASYRTVLHNGVFTYVRDGRGRVDLTIGVPRTALAHLATGNLDQATAAGMSLHGDDSALRTLLSMLEPGDPAFNIIEP